MNETATTPLLSWEVRFKRIKEYPSWYECRHAGYASAYHMAELLAAWAGVPLSKVSIKAVLA